MVFGYVFEQKQMGVSHSERNKQPFIAVLLLWFWSVQSAPASTPRAPWRSPAAHVLECRPRLWVGQCGARSGSKARNFLQPGAVLLYLWFLFI